MTDRVFEHATLIGAEVVLVLRRVDGPPATSVVRIRFASQLPLPSGEADGVAAQIVSGDNVHHLDAARTQFVMNGLNQLAGVLASPGPLPGSEPS